MRILPFLLCVALVSASGCASPEATDDPSPGTADDGGNETTPPDGPDGGGHINATANSAPVADLSADVARATIPFNVTLTLSGSDADDDPLRWHVLQDAQEIANGSSLPAEIAVAIAAPGNHTFVATVTDGNATVQRNVTVEGLAAAAAEPVVFSGSALVPDPWAIALNGCLMDAGRRDAGGPDGITGTDHAIDPAWWGYTYAFDVAGVIAEFWTDEPAILGAGASGSVPEEATYVVVCINDPEAAQTDYVLTLTP